jgi:2-polyprenyl-3-methyl-5-hydroxy-6-metoxy-1,4-benzoquinol methylase
MRRYNPEVAVNEPCVICGGSESTLLFETEFKKFNYNGVFFMRTCASCGLRFCSPRLTEEDIASLYGEDYYVFAKSDESYFARTAEIYDRTIALADTGALPRRAAEVGSGKGYLLAVLNKLGWETYGIEISSSAADYAKATFGVESFTGRIEDYFASDQTKEPFSAILCIDIIEHVTDPEEFVKDLAALTAEGGTVMIDTPNGGAWHIEVEGADWRGFNPFHIYLFNQANLTRLLERHGFKVSQTFTYNNFKKRRKGAFAYTKSVIERLVGRKSASEARLLEECVAACRDAKGYRKTEDAKGELADGCRGENLVVFAERV